MNGWCKSRKKLWKYYQINKTIGILIEAHNTEIELEYKNKGMITHI